MAKIERRHLDRKALIYVRQSSMAQVLHHRESTQRQYHMGERAQALGWSKEQVEVIDDDQGQSGATSTDRVGFQRLASQVAVGAVGAVIGIEVSRLARSCADWFRLLEVAALTHTLIIDEEGVYDPNHYNDRLLLGLKGTLSEAELHFLKQRMIGGRRNKASRGKFRIPVPAGYIWEPDEGIRMDPDERVRDTIAMFFRCFDRLGSVAAVARHFAEQKQLYPRRDVWGSQQTSVTWGPLSISHAALVLRNPTYAGVYAYSRRSPDEVDDEDPCAGGRIFIPASHPGYITLEQYEKNQARVAANRSEYGDGWHTGSPREGPALMQGLVMCGRCGHRMLLSYSKQATPRYWCRSRQSNRTCQEVDARGAEVFVEREVLDALARKELELAVKAVDELRERLQEVEQQWSKRVEAARYEAERAARRYHHVEPENRLVARTLEGEWNAHLQHLAQLEEEHARVRHTTPIELTVDQREQVLALAKDVPRLWRAPTTTNAQRKRLVRLLVADVTLQKSDDPWGIEVGIRWRTGAATRGLAERIRPYPHTTRAEVVDRIRELMAQKTDAEIADVLNEEGRRSGYGKPFVAGMISHLRWRHGLGRRPR